MEERGVVPSLAPRRRSRQNRAHFDEHLGARAVVVGQSPGQLDRHQLQARVRRIGQRLGVLAVGQVYSKVETGDDATICALTIYQLSKSLGSLSGKQY